MSLALTTRYERTDFGPGAVGWLYEYWNDVAIEKTGMGAGLEIGVQLEGEWAHQGATHGAVLCSRGMIHRIDPAERYRLSFRNPIGRGAQVGFVVYPSAISELATDGDVRFAGDSGARDARLFELCRAFRASEPSPRRDAEALAEVVAYVRRHCISVAADPLVRARAEIDATLQHDLSMLHFADVASLHRETFARAFKRRFGVTPATYRLQARLNLAGRLAWSRPAWSLEQVALESGFFDLPYFHRTFRRNFGCTPAVWARRARSPVTR